MNEKNPNEYRNNLAQKLRGAREIDKGMAQQFLEKNQETKEYQDARNEKISAHNTNANENKSENIEKEIEQESENLSKRQEKISNLSSELGGKEGVKEIFNKMSPVEKARIEQKISELKNKIIEKEHVLKKGKFGNMIDDSYELTTAFMDVSFTYEDLEDFPPVIREAITLLSFLMGVTGTAITGLPKGIQQICRKISLGFKKRNLSTLESKLA